VSLQPVERRATVDVINLSCKSSKKRNVCNKFGKLFWPLAGMPQVYESYGIIIVSGKGPFGT
jgi:hypothetical protein